MAKNKYSEALQDAYMLGDLERIAELKALIAKEHTPVKTKKPTIVYGNNILNNNDAPVTKIYDFLNSKYGKAWVNDEYETLDKLLWTDYGVVLDGVNRDKVHALRHLSNSFNPYIDWYEFNQVALALGGAMADFEVLRRPSPGMLINAVKVMVVMKGDEEFGSDVLDYIAICLINEGISTPPPTIARLIAASMHKFTKQSASWAEVGGRFDERAIDESIAGIQAKRLIVAEEAARKYF